MREFATKTNQLWNIALNINTFELVRNKLLEWSNTKYYKLYVCKYNLLASWLRNSMLNPVCKPAHNNFWEVRDIMCICNFLQTLSCKRDRSVYPESLFIAILKIWNVSRLPANVIMKFCERDRADAISVCNLIETLWSAGGGGGVGVLQFNCATCHDCSRMWYIHGNQCSAPAVIFFKENIRDLNIRVNK